MTFVLPATISEEFLHLDENNDFYLTNESSERRGNITTLVMPTTSLQVLPFISSPGPYHETLPGANSNYNYVLCMLVFETLQPIPDTVVLECVFRDAEIDLDAILADQDEERNSSVDQLSAGVDQPVGVLAPSFLQLPADKRKK